MEAILKKEIIINKALCRIIGVAIFIILTSLGAFVRIPLPFTPVPLTLQTFFVLLSGAFLGAELGLAAQLSYLLLGISGLPIFSGAGSGLLYLSGPTAGYIFGFIVAAFLVGKLIPYSRGNFLFTFSIFCLADFILLFCGVFWLKIILGGSFKELLLIGFLPFIPGDLCKAALAAVIYSQLKSRLKEIF